MANTSRPAGLVPYQHMSGGTPMRMGSYKIVTTQAGNLFQGDPVVLTTGVATATRQITIAAIAVGITSKILGSFAGVRYTASDGSIVFSNKWVGGTTLATGTVAEAYVYDDPDMLFTVQATTIAVDDIGEAGQLILGAGNATTGISGVTLGAVGAAAANQIQVVDLAPWPDNELGANAKAIVRIMTHQYRALVGV